MDHAYLKPFPGDIFSPDQSTHQHSMSIEYLSVAPNLRKSNLPISLGSALLGISMKVFSESNAYSVLGTARKKLHVDQLCYEFGFEPVGNIEKFGLNCTLISNTKETLRAHPDKQTNELVERLWKTKLDFREERFSPNENIRRVA